MKLKTVLITFLLCSLKSLGQSVDYWHNLAFSDGQQAWITYENDIFTATDRYYSQGISACYKRTIAADASINSLFLKLPSSQKTVGFGIDHQAFTPTTIAFDSMMYNNHPYAATIRANAFFESVNTTRGTALSWTISTGIIGPEAMGKQMQTAVHKATANPRPQGWEYQINTGLLLDAGMFARQRIAGIGRWFLLVAEENANLGTSRIDLRLGTRLQLKLATENSRFLFAVYFRPAARFIGYDATLQGSLIGQPSNVKVSDARVSRAVFEREFGAIARVGNFSMTGVFNLHTHQYNDGMTHRWGGISITWIF